LKKKSSDYSIPKRYSAIALSMLYLAIRRFFAFFTVAYTMRFGIAIPDLIGVLIT
jgi:hypothetical protein